MSYPLFVFQCFMSFLNAFSKQPNKTSVVVPPEIAARISVMSDHVTEAGTPSSDDTLHETAPPIPLGATEMPHGPFSAEDPMLANAPTTRVQPVSQESAESSPFLQTLAPESLQVTQKVKPQVESPMFLTEKSQVPQFGFGQAQSFSQSSPVSNEIQKGKSEEKKIVFQDNPSVSSQKSWWALSFFLLVLLSALGGAYYYFYIYSVKLNDSTDHSGLQSVSTPVAPEDEKPAFEFSLVSPNYLSVNVETVSAGEFRAQLEGIGGKMKSAHIATPVEFFVTDQTNTPIAFSRFVVLIGLKLPANVVSMTEEKFSLFLFNDQDRTRIGLRISLKGNRATGEVLKKAETDFPSIFQNFFLGSKVIPQKKYVFKESLYNDMKIRYVNISEADILSLDYSVDGNSWLVGTSKNTLRAIWDAQKK